MEYLAIIGLGLNFIGVILVFLGITAAKSGVEFNAATDGGKWETSYPSKFNHGFLYSGLFCLLIGLALQIVKEIQGIPC